MKPDRTISIAFVLLILIVQIVPAGQTAHAVSYCDWASFVSDVTISDGTSFAPGTAFTKTWRIKNVGTCAWTTSYSLVFYSGEQMGASASLTLPNKVDPGGSIDLSVPMTAPSKNGTFRGNWMLKNASGVLFGLGSKAASPFWVEIKVAATTSGAYDFVSEAGKATWSSGSGALTFPGTDGDAKGYVIKVDSPKLENGTTSSASAIVVGPQNVTDGYIQGIYPAFTVQKGDRFQAVIGCAYNATNCYVTYKLDYQVGDGAVKNFWTFRERYEGLVYAANLDLSSLAGQNVKFILKVDSYGSAAGDKAMWTGAQIVRAGVIATPTPETTTPTATPPAASCDKASFVADVTVPDGSSFAPNATFNKTWRIKNAGTCKWTTAYTLVFDKGEQMGASGSTTLPSEVAPGGSIDLTLAMKAPASAGSYRGYWKLKNASGASFGIGVSGTSSFYVDIKVTTGATATPIPPTKTPTPGPSSTPSASGYDFAAHTCDAIWTSGAGTLACPGTDGDAKGVVKKVDSPKLEDGTMSSKPGIAVMPQKVTDGYIQAVFPLYAVQSGDKFKAAINCQYQANGCNVIFKLDYQVDGETVKNLWQFNEAYEGLYYNVNVDLSSLVGKQVKFILKVLANGSADADAAMWVGPVIAK
jgi:hypothetical protein